MSSSACALCTAGAGALRLLGEADAIPFVKAGEADDRRHLLVPVPDALDQQLWRLDWHDPPQLLVNKDAKPSWKEMARSPYFIALVYPEVLRRMLTDLRSWAEDVGRRLAGRLGSVRKEPRRAGTVPPRPGEREIWIEEAVGAFATPNRVPRRTCDEEGRR